MSWPAGSAATLWGMPFSNAASSRGTPSYPGFSCRGGQRAEREVLSLVGAGPEGAQANECRAGRRASGKARLVCPFAWLQHPPGIAAARKSGSPASPASGSAAAASRRPPPAPPLPARRCCSPARAAAGVQPRGQRVRRTSNGPWQERQGAHRYPADQQPAIGASGSIHNTRTDAHLRIQALAGVGQVLLLSRHGAPQ